MQADCKKLLYELAMLSEGWHAAGSLTKSVLEAIVRHCTRIPMRHSMETGCGKSTLLFSHLSEDHKVFCLDPQVSDTIRVDKSPLLNASHVEFILGPTQKTLPVYKFQHPLDAVFLDGPHAYPFPDLEYYYTYQHMAPGAVLIIDDIDIPTIRNMFRVLKKESMFELAEVVHTTAFFYRTSAPLFDPLGDGWGYQGFNRSKLLKDRLAYRLRQRLPPFAVTLLRHLCGTSR